MPWISNQLSYSLTNGLGKVASAKTYYSRGLERFSSEPLSRCCAEEGAKQKHQLTEGSHCWANWLCSWSLSAALLPAGAESLKLISILGWLGQQFLLIIPVNICWVLIMYQKLSKKFTHMRIALSNPHNCKRNDVIVSDLLKRKKDTTQQLIHIPILRKGWRWGKPRVWTP